MAILESVKLAARIRNDKIDSDIERLITWTQAEMERVGVPSAVAADEDNPLVSECSIQGVLSRISNDEKIREAAEKSFLYQLDCMRKHNWNEEEYEDAAQ